MMGRQLRIATQTVVLLAALVGMGLAVAVGYLEEPAGRVLGLVLAAWVGAPYLVLLHAVRLEGADRLHGWVVLATACAFAVAGIAVYYHARFVDPEPPSGTAFFVVPLWQLIAAAVVVWALRRRM